LHDGLGGKPSTACGFLGTILATFPFGDVSMHTDQRGFSLVETMVALAILAFGVMGIYGIHNFAIRNNQNAARASEATFLAQRTMSELARQPFEPGDANLGSIGAGAAIGTGSLANPGDRHADLPGIIDAGPVNRYGSTDAVLGPVMYRRSFFVEPVSNNPEQVRVTVRVSFEDRAFVRSDGTYPKHSVTLATTRAWGGDNRLPTVGGP
jgi:prepilin-type N-terminal cleavage/methylation domain-containing protein